MKKPITERRLIWGIILSLLFIALGIAWIAFAPSAFEQLLGIILILAAIVHILYLYLGMRKVSN